MRIEDIYEYDLENPIKIDGEIKSFLNKKIDENKKIIKKGDKYPLGFILAHAFKELFPERILDNINASKDVMQITKGKKVTFRNNLSQIAYGEIRKKSKTFIYFANLLDNDEKKRLEYFLTEILIKDLNIYENEQIAKQGFQFKNFELVNRWKALVEVLNYGKYKWSDVNQTSVIYAKTIGILYEESNADFFPFLKQIIEMKPVFNEKRWMKTKIKLEIKYLESIERIINGFSNCEDIMNERYKNIYQIYIAFFESFMKEKNVVNFNEINNIGWEFSNLPNDFMEKYLKDEDKLYLRNLLMESNNNMFFPKESLPKQIVENYNKEKVIKQSLSSKVVDDKVIILINVKLVNYNLLMSKSFENSAFSKKLSYCLYRIINSDVDMKEIKKKIEVVKNEWIDMSDPELLTDKLNELKKNKEDFQESLLEKMKGLKSLLKKENIYFGMNIGEMEGLDNNEVQWYVEIVTDSDLKEAVTNILYEALVSDNVSLSNENDEVLNSMIMKDLMKKEMKNQNLIGVSQKKIRKF